MQMQCSCKNTKKDLDNFLVGVVSRMQDLSSTSQNIYYNYHGDIYVHRGMCENRREIWMWLDNEVKRQVAHIFTHIFWNNIFTIRKRSLQR